MASVGQVAADFNNEGQGLVERLHEVVRQSPALAQQIRDNPPGTFSIAGAEPYSRKLAAFRQPIQLWRNHVSIFLQEDSEELWASWPTIATQLDRTFDNSTYALEYAVGGELWARTSSGGIVASALDETGKALKPAVAVAVGALVALAFLVLYFSRR